MKSTSYVVTSWMSTCIGVNKAVNKAIVAVLLYTIVKGKG